MAALRFHRAMLGALARRLGRDRRWRTVLAVTPDRARFPPPLRAGAAGAGRPGGADGAGAGAGPAGAVLVGSDIPDVRAVRHRGGVPRARRRRRTRCSGRRRTGGTGWWGWGRGGPRPVPRRAVVRPARAGGHAGELPGGGAWRCCAGCATWTARRIWRRGGRRAANAPSDRLPEPPNTTRRCFGARHPRCGGPRTPDAVPRVEGDLATTPLPQTCVTSMCMEVV